MSCIFSSFSFIKSNPLAIASLHNGNSPLPQTPQPNPNTPNNPHILKTKTSTPPRKRQRRRPPPQRQQQQKLVQIERAIGAGSFRDTDSSDLDERKTIFDGLLPITTGKFEGPVEKKLREIGEGLASRTERQFQSSGKGMLMVSFKYILPIWTLLLLVASGVIKLPFTTPLLEDLIM